MRIWSKSRAAIHDDIVARHYEANGEMSLSEAMLVQINLNLLEVKSGVQILTVIAVVALSLWLKPFF
jgi:hypothetical protein